MARVGGNDDVELKIKENEKKEKEEEEEESYCDEFVNVNEKRRKKYCVRHFHSFSHFSKSNKATESLTIKNSVSEDEGAVVHTTETPTTTDKPLVCFVVPMSEYTPTPHSKREDPHTERQSEEELMKKIR
jgi:hypothetical protein